MLKTLKLTVACMGLVLWGSTCFAQASSTSPDIDVSLRNQAEGGPESTLKANGLLDTRAKDNGGRLVGPSTATTSSEIARIESECSAIEASIAKLKEASETDLKVVQARLGMLCRFGQAGYAVPMLSARDMDEGWEAAYYAVRLIKSDQELFERFRARGSEIDRLQGRLAVKTQELDRARAGVAEGIKSGRRIVRKPIQKPPGGGFGGLQGALPLPATGSLINTYGAKPGAGVRASLYRNGVLVKAPRGEPIQAVCDGVVVFADWFKEYGKTMIIDHGDHYFTLVAHADQFFKTVDERVRSGDSIATVGSTGSQDSPGVYFEIRHYGKPVDPMEWLAVRQLSEE